MRRLHVLVATVLLLAAGLAPPASAADSTEVERGGGGNVALTTCAAHPRFVASHPTGVLQDNPETDDEVAFALGERAFRYEFPNTEAVEDFAAGPRGFNDAPDAAGTFDVRVNAISGPLDGLVLVIYHADNFETSDYWLGYEPITVPEGWHTVDAETRTLTWVHWNDTLGAFDDTDPDATRTDFVAAHPGSDPGAVEAFAFGCDRNALFTFDRFRSGPTGSVLTRDFEARVPTVTQNPSPATITAGQGVTLAAALNTFDSISGGLILQAKPYGTAGFSFVSDELYDWNGGDPIPATFAVHPLRQTQYRWHFLGNTSYESAYSAIRTVNVRTAVTMTPKAKRIRKGRNLVVTGSVLPRRGGLAVTLQRKVNGVWTSWKSTTTTSTGAYVIKKRMRRTGIRYIRVVTAASAGNLSGTSAVVRIRIVR